MRVAMVANWWYRRGGLGGVMLDETSWLSGRGHEIMPFAAAHPANLPASTSRFFPPFVETAELGAGLVPFERLRAARAVIHNRDAARLFAEFIRSVRPDLVHLHGMVRQLSPSILGVAREAGLPIVMTLHDFGLVCPQGLMWKGGRSACTTPNCVLGNPLYALRFRCIKDSFAGSALGSVEYLVHRSLGWYRERVQLFIAPSRFLMDTVGRSGAVDPSRLRHLPNGLSVPSQLVDVPQTGGHVLFTGRLVPEKGLMVLIDAARRLPRVPFVIAGDGPLREELSRAAPSNVSFLGHQEADKLDELRDQAVAVVSPSVWYENAPLAVLEAMRASRAVVVTEPGGQAELIANGGGIVVRAGEVEGLAAAVAALWEDRLLARRVGSIGRQTFLASYSADRHVEGLEAIYLEALRMAEDVDVSWSLSTRRRPPN